jgi:hypothetical protein
MYIKLTKDYLGPLGYFKAETVLDVSEAEGNTLIDRGAAVDPNAPEPEAVEPAPKAKPAARAKPKAK